VQGVLSGSETSIQSWGDTIHHAAFDCKFATAKWLIPKILDSVEVNLLWKFFHKTWWYMDAYD